MQPSRLLETHAKTIDRALTEYFHYRRLRVEVIEKRLAGTGRCASFRRYVYRRGANDPGLVIEGEWDGWTVFVVKGTWKGYLQTEFMTRLTFSAFRREQVPELVQELTAVLS